MPKTLSNEPPTGPARRPPGTTLQKPSGIRGPMRFPGDQPKPPPSPLAGKQDDRRGQDQPG